MFLKDEFMFAFVSIIRIIFHVLSGLIKVTFLFPFLNVASKDLRIKKWSYMLLKICKINLKIKNLEFNNDANSSIIICNHISWLDIFVINSKNPCRFIAKSEIRSWPVIGWLCKQTGTIFIYRSKQKDIKRIFLDIIKIIHKGERVAFFPEGTTSPQGKIRDFHSSLFESAIKTRSTIQPYAIRYLKTSGGFNNKVEYIGNITLFESLLNILKEESIIVELIQLPTINSDRLNRRELSIISNKIINDALTKTINS